MDLPKSANKFSLVSRDRLETLLLSLEGCLDRNILKLMTKEALCTMVCFGIHAEEDSAVPAKPWAEFRAACHDAYGQTGKRLKGITFTSELVEKPVLDYAKHGVFELLLADDGKTFAKVRHWSGAEVVLQDGLPIEYYIIENYHEQKAKVVSATAMFECGIMKLFVQAGLEQQIPPRTKADKVGELVRLALCARARALALEDTRGSSGEDDEGAAAPLAGSGARGSSGSIDGARRPAPPSGHGGIQIAAHHTGA